MSKNCTRLGAGSLAFAFGLWWGIGVMLMGWAGWLWGYGVVVINLWSHLYYGYAPTLLGGVIGGVIGFVDVFIFVWLSAIVYNACVSKCSSE